MLITVYQKRNGQNITEFKDLQKVLPQEKNQISTALKKLEARDLVKKPPYYSRFKSVVITEQGVRQAKRKITLLKKILSIS